MGARGGRLRESLELRIRAESGSTLMIDSATPVRLSPASTAGTEYGIGIHAGVESGALLVILTMPLTQTLTQTRARARARTLTPTLALT